MKVQTDAQTFLRAVERRVEVSVQELVPEARRNLGGGGALSGSVRMVQIGPLRWLVGSDHPGARAQELGAFVRPRRRKALRFEGRFSAHARIPAKHWLARAAKSWPKFVRHHLGESR